MRVLKITENDFAYSIAARDKSEKSVGTKIDFIIFKESIFLLSEVI